MKNLLVGFLIIIAFISGYLISQKYNLKIETKSPTLTMTSSTEPTITEISSPSSTPTPSIEVQENLKEIIKQLLINIHGQTADNLNITISKQEGNYAKGGASAQGGGGMWLATKHDGKWTIIFEGNGAPDCKFIRSFNFPEDMLVNVCD